MRTLAIALVLGLLGAGTASAAPRHHHAKKHHARSMKQAKAKTRHSGVPRACRGAVPSSSAEKSNRKLKRSEEIQILIF